MIYVGLEYIANQIVSSKFAIDIALLSSYFVISNNHVTGSITETDFRFKFYLFPFIIMI